MASCRSGVPGAGDADAPCYCSTVSLGVRWPHGLPAQDSAASLHLRLELSTHMNTTNVGFEK